jgi:hypothetical protein
MVEMTWNTMDVIMLAIFCEALVELWKTAAPIQPLKEWLVERTPWLYSERLQTHLLMCPYCLSLYASIVAILFYYYVGHALVWWSVCVLVVHRLSNLTHLIISTIKEHIIDRRIARR